MLVTYKTSKTFYSDHLTHSKFQQIKEFAEELLNFKNQISSYINFNLSELCELSKFDFINHIRKQFSKEFSSYFSPFIYVQLYNSYRKRVEGTLSYAKFYIYRPYLYNGQFKYKKEQTPLCLTLNYIMKYGEQTLEIIKKSQNTPIKGKQKFYNTVKYHIDKFTWERLYDIAKRKRKAVLCNYAPIKYSSLNFTGKTTLSYNILSFNDNRTSMLKGFINLTFPFKKGKFNIPVKISNSYHGNLNEYQKENKFQFTYHLTFINNKQISIQIIKEYQKEVSKIENNNYIGIDVNIKHNLFALSTGETYDYNRQLIQEYLNELNSNKTGKRQIKKLNTIKRKIKHDIERIISNMCKEHPNSHFVMENLIGKFKCAVNDPYSDIIEVLNIQRVKDMVKHIAEKHNILVSFIQPEFTSQTCSKCGHIEKTSRKNQETFICKECGYEINADLNAAVNIKVRVAETEFRNALLKQTPTGSYLPSTSITGDDVLQVLAQRVTYELDNF